MRPVVSAAIFAALTTFVVALSLRAASAALAIVAVAAVTGLVTWFAGQFSTDETSGLALANPASAVALTVVGRSSVTVLLPLIAAQVVGALLGGLGAMGLDSVLGDTLIWPEPDLVATGVVVLVLGIAATWLLFAIDAQISEGFAAIPPLLAGAALPLSLGSALNPSVVVGLATAGLLPWTIAGVAAGVGLVAGVVGAYTVALITPTEEH